MFSYILNFLYPKLNFNNLSKLTLFDTSLAMKTQPNIISFSNVNPSGRYYEMY